MVLYFLMRSENGNIDHLFISIDFEYSESLVVHPYISVRNSLIQKDDLEVSQ